MMYIVKFLRRDRQPIEEYNYNTIEEARWHLGLFNEDDSGLYEQIQITCDDEPETVIDALAFDK